MPRRKLKSIKDIDKTLLVLLGFLILFGIVMIYNATVVYSQGTFGGAYRFALLQIVWVLVGLIGFWAFFQINYSNIRKISLPIFGTALGFLLLLGIASIFVDCESGTVPFTPCINGTFRWFYFNPAPLPEIPLLGRVGFQPSEFTKLALVIYLAVLLEKNIKKGLDVFYAFLVIAGLTSFLILLQPNMSTAVLLFLIGLVMYFSSGASIKPLILTIPGLFVAGLGFILFSEYRRDRLLTFLNPEDSAGLSLSYHIKQIQIALGSGGIFGLGFGQSRQKFKYLPEVSADSIFAIIGEEFGFIGTAVFVLIFSILIYKGFSIAKQAPDMLGKLLAVGVTSWIGLQFFVNIAAMTRLIPLTGIPIPLVSYGGSSAVFTLMALGLLANISAKSRT